jgi:hypothetical protein
MKSFLRSVAVALAAGFLFAHASEPAAKNPPAIAEVHTWGELLAQKPIVLAAAGNNPGMPATCRLGIDCTRANLYGGAVIYCLVEGKSGYYLSHDSLGPLLIQEAGTGQEKIRQLEGGATVDPIAAPMYLFMRIIPLTTPGGHTYNLCEMHDDSPIVATAKIAVAKEQAQPWHPFLLPETPDSSSDSADSTVGGSDEDIARIEVVIPTEGIALPALNPPGPFPVKTQPAAKLPLPQLFPTIRDPGMHLGIRGNLLTVTFDKPVVASDPYDLIFLTRWWVNGKLYVPKSTVPVISRAIEWPASWMKGVAFHIDTLPKGLHAQKGDEIAVQLLFCPGGWDYTGPPRDLAVQEKAMAMVDQDSPIAIARLSPRIDFTYTGDPAAISPAPKQKPEVKP